MPLTSEFLFVVLVSLILIMLFTSAILSQISSARSAAKYTEQINSAESIALAVDSALNCGITTEFSDFFTIEQNKLHMKYEGKIIEVGGVFIYDNSEPI
ncbi:MAG: hypothetical protein ABID61_04095 [Candidatus Micrarchaeota archaeon]